MDKKYKELEELVQPIIDWLYENGDPYTTVSIAMDLVKVDQTSAGIPLEVRG